MNTQSADVMPKEELIPLAKIAGLAPDTLTGVNVDGVDIVLVNSADRILAYDGRCPHMGTLLGEGDMENGLLTCRAHGWQFDCVTGQRSGDQTICLARLSVIIEDGQVLAHQDELNALKGQSKEVDQSQIKTYPGPRAWPVIGSLFSVNRRAFHLTLEDWSKRYGSIYSCRLGRVSMTVTSDATIANEILKARPDSFRRTSQLEVVSISGMNTHGIFMAEGDRWRKQRPVIMQSLDTRHLNQFFPFLVEVTERLRKRWLSSSGSAVDVQSDLMRFTVDVTASLAFGQDINTLESDGDIIQQHLDKIFPTIQRRLLTPFPYWHYFRLPADRDAEKSVQFINEAIRGFILEGQKELKESPELREKPKNLLQSLLVAVADENSNFSDKEVSDNMMTMLLAGEDTTANSLAWTIYFLVKYPEIQARLREEIQGVLAGEPLSNINEVRAIPYLDGVIHESMRLKPVAPINVLEANAEFSTGELSFNKGDYVVILTRMMAMNEADFADAGTFNPERWLADKSENQVNQRAFTPFGSGPRLCPGRNLALLEIKLVLVMILNNFEIRSCVDLDGVSEEFSFTMHPNGLKVRFEKLP
jgi:cytochrome P450/nitrite reductase/ring-hydroxylating ferredoxin subunit